MLERCNNVKYDSVFYLDLVSDKKSVTVVNNSELDLFTRCPGNNSATIKPGKFNLWFIYCCVFKALVGRSKDLCKFFLPMLLFLILSKPSIFYPWAQICFLFYLYSIVLQND